MVDFSQLSIVVPIGPGDTSWQVLLHDLAAFGSSPEIILSACEPQPGSIKLPDSACWLCGPQGRARQLNNGARKANRPFIWLVHADTRCGEEVRTCLLHFIERDIVSLGYFKLGFASDGPALTRLNAEAANIRSRLLELPFGDQGFVIKKSIFFELHGFDETIGLGEDLDFVVRFKASGLPIIELPAMLITSARRYRHQGWLKTTLRHLWLTWQLTRQSKQRLNEAS